jgi:cytochrome oxidase assembly protein ShyY1
MKSVKYRLPLVATVITFIAVVIMFALGMWQLQRAEQKTLRLQSMENASESAQLGVTQVLADIDNMQDMPIHFKAQPDIQHYFLLDNKIHQGRVGYQVLVPLKTNSGVVIANFGWVSATHSRDILPEVQIDPTAVLYSGIVSFPTKNILVTETAIVDGNWPKVLQAVDLKVLQQHYNQPLLPLVVKLADKPESGFIRQWRTVIMAPEKHVAYAVQWFLLALAAVIIFIIAQIKKTKNIKRKKSE